MLTGIEYSVAVLQKEEVILTKEYQRIQETILRTTTSIQNDARDIINERLKSIKIAMKMLEETFQIKHLKGA